MHKKNLFLNRKDVSIVYKIKYRIFFLRSYIFEFLMVCSGLALIILFCLDAKLLVKILCPLFLIISFAIMVLGFIFKKNSSNRIYFKDYVEKNLSYYIDGGKLFVFEGENIILNFTVVKEEKIDDYILLYKNERDFFIIPEAC